MEIEGKIKIKTDSGTTVELSIQEARSLYFQLKQLFITDNYYQSPWLFFNRDSASTFILDEGNSHFHTGLWYPQQ